MTFYDPSTGRLGTCNACGGDVVDGGQSGSYCRTPGCRHSWGGAPKTETRERASAPGLRVQDWCEVCKDTPAGQRWLCPNAANHRVVADP